MNLSDDQVFAVVLVALVVCTFLGVFARYLFNRPFNWLEEMQLAAMVWISFLMAGVCFRRGGHVAIEIIVDSLPERAQRVIEVLMPERYRRLRGLTRDMECSSILELLDRMIDAHTIDNLNKELRQEFEDAARAENGKPLEYGARTRQKSHKSVDMYEKPQTIHFDPIYDNEDKSDY